MKTKYGLPVVTTMLATLMIGCTAQQMAQFEHNMQQAQQNTDNRQRACISEAEHSWGLYSGAVKGDYEKSIGSGLYEIKVTAQKHSGICTVTDAGMVRGVMNDDGTNASSGKHHSGSSNVGSDYDRGCADAKAGSYDRSGNATQAYESGWNACHNTSNSRSAGSEYERGCGDAKAGSYDRSGNATQDYENGWNACRGASNSGSGGSEYDRGCYDAKAGAYDRSGNATKAYEDGWNACRR